MKISVIVNEKKYNWEVEPGERVIDLLRRHGFHSVRNSCDYRGFCGNCAIFLDGKIINSCLLLAPQIDGKTIDRKSVV